MSKTASVILGAAVLIGVFVVSGISWPGRTQGTNPPSRGGMLSVAGTVDAVRLTLSVPNRTYPRHAILIASVRVHNLASHEVSAVGTSCTQTNPYVDSLSAGGHELYPAAFPWLNLLPDCGATTEDTFMPPGYDSVYHVITLAMGPRLQAAMWFRPKNSNTQVVARYPALAIRLGPADPPRAAVREKHGSLSISLAPAHATHANLEYVSLAHCYRGTAPYDYLGVFWSFTSATGIQSECDPASTWRVVAGWPGQSAAFVDYRNPSAKLSTY